MSKNNFLAYLKGRLKLLSNTSYPFENISTTKSQAVRLLEFNFTSLT